jgi:GNAT superfamily N-acetyltransferase
VIIRAADARDLDAIADLWSSVVGDPVTGDALRSWDALTLASERRLRLVAEDGGRLVGLLGLVRTADSPVCGLRLFVAEGARRQGLGSKLCLRARAFAAIEGCDTMATTARDVASEAFASRRGLSVVARTTIMERAIARDETFESATPEGIDVRLVNELEGDAEDAFYVTVRALGAELGPPLSRAHFDARVLGSEGRYRALQVVALSQGHIVGVSCFEPFIGTRTLLHTLTAVATTHRGRGIGKALKVRAMRAARDWGATALRAHNDPNAPMFAINRRCGFHAIGTEATLVGPADLIR